MPRLFLALMMLLALVSTGQAQGVVVAPLSAPDVFSGGSRDTGLGPDLWQGSSATVVRRILPVLANRPLSPAARALAIQVLSTGGRAPDGAAEDRGLAHSRARALLAMGAPDAALTSAERLPNIGADPALAEVLAESALIMGEDVRACRIETGMTVGRSDLYWLRLRAYCQAILGQFEAAQLSLTLANEAGRDAAFFRLMTAVLVGGDAGAPSVRNGVNLALSRRLGLKISAEGAPPAIALAIRAPITSGQLLPEALASDPLGSARRLVEQGDVAGAQAVRSTLDAADSRWSSTDLALLDALIAAADSIVSRFDVGPLTRLQGSGAAPLTAALWMAALGAPIDAEIRPILAASERARAAPNAVNLLALSLAAEAGAVGETALLAVAVAADGGAAGPAPSDRAAIIRALRRVGLDRSAAAFAVEGLSGLMTGS